MSREFYEEAQERMPNQRTRILNALREAGSKGATNAELSGIAQRWGARIQELYVQGYEITVESLGNGLCRYTLISEPKTIKKQPSKAIDVLIEKINNDYNGEISSESLSNLLQSLNFNITRKPNSHKNI